jgi:hypothetical protein
MDTSRKRNLPKLLGVDGFSACRPGVKAGLGNTCLASELIQSESALFAEA